MRVYQFRHVGNGRHDYRVFDWLWGNILGKILHHHADEQKVTGIVGKKCRGREFLAYTCKTECAKREIRSGIEKAR
ncbi:hypothetical protein ACO0LG_11550 [Undibacterium sp. Ji42W]|uniref:hypothetical protein n=1 Tax=Undibacterium sp. Ji42W TaxID=3413039 RepID=UPI003BF0D586